MQMSQNVSNIVPALLKAQRAMGGAIKGSKNPFYKSTYADLGAVLAACKEELNNNGIVILQPHFNNEAGSYVQTVLFHESGEFVTSDTPVICAKQNDPQAHGAAITYARRFGLQSLLSLPAEDDDGETAMDRKPKTSSKASSLPQVEASTQLSDSEVKAVVATVVANAEVEKPKNSWRKMKTLASPAVEDVSY